MYYQCNIKGTFAKPLLLRKALGITHSDCVSMVLFMQHAKDLLRIVLLSVFCLALPYFFHIASFMARLSERSY
jgi:hypothetical protein